MWRLCNDANLHESVSEGETLNLNQCAGHGRMFCIHLSANFRSGDEGRWHIRDIGRFFKHIVHRQIELLEDFCDISVGLSHLRFHATFPHHRPFLIETELT